MKGEERARMPKAIKYYIDTAPGSDVAMIARYALELEKIAIAATALVKLPGFDGVCDEECALMQALKDAGYLEKP